MSVSLDTEPVTLLESSDLILDSSEGEVVALATNLSNSVTLAEPVEAESVNPLNFPYPEGTIGATSDTGNYWGRLSPAYAANLEKVEEFVKKNNINLYELNPYALDHKLTLLRYLRANDGNVKKACELIMSNVTWRQNKKITETGLTHPNDLLGVNLLSLVDLFPHWHNGFDRSGRPILYKVYSKFDISKIKKVLGGSFEKLMTYHVWEQEACQRLCYEKSLERKEIIETMTAVIDVKGMSIFQVTSDFIALIKQMAEIDSKNYPETLGHFYIINAPSAFPMAWKLIKGFLDPVTVSKITVLDSKKSIPTLIEMIGAENLPSNYGGVLPPLNSSVHPYLETMNKEFSFTAL